ncbi:hypothetical protein ABZ883_14720 [Streptomyces sp. NPDC046977]|uniref:hypothetical protein n=1 Tax=Streptomyces sp. NPDC046977 TaxID=3154703 RepID=UPI0033FDAC59
MTRPNPSPEQQLLDLVTRAERGALLPDEAALLRTAIQAGAEARRSAGGLQRALQTERARVRELEHAARLVAAVAEIVEANGLWWAADSVRRALTGSLAPQEPAGGPHGAPDTQSPTRAATGATQAAGDPR